MNLNLTHRHLFSGIMVMTMMGLAILSISHRSREIVLADNGELLSIVSKRYQLENPDVAMNKKGDVVLTWQEKRDSDYDIIGMKIDDKGDALAAPFSVNNYKVNDQKKPQVGMDQWGNFVVIWESFGQDGSGAGIFGQRFLKTGKKYGVEFRINDFTEGNQMMPHVDMNEQGDFAVVWTNIPKYMKERRIFMKKFEFIGSLQSKEKRVDSLADFKAKQGLKSKENGQSGELGNPKAAINSNGVVWVVWEALIKGDWEIRGQAFNAEGTRLGVSDLNINNTVEGEQISPALSVLGENQFIVTWEKNIKSKEFKDLDLLYENIQAALLNEQGSKTGNEIEVNEPNLNHNDKPEIAPTEDGVVILWQARKKVIDESDSRIKKIKYMWTIEAQKLDFNGGKIEDVLELNQKQKETLTNLQAASDSENTIGVVWKGQKKSRRKGAISFKKIVVESAPAPLGKAVN